MTICLLNPMLSIAMLFLADNYLTQDLHQISPSPGTVLAADWLSALFTTQQCKMFTHSTVCQSADNFRSRFFVHGEYRLVLYFSALGFLFSRVVSWGLPVDLTCWHGGRLLGYRNEPGCYGIHTPGWVLFSRVARVIAIKVRSDVLVWHCRWIQNKSDTVLFRWFLDRSYFVSVLWHHFF